MSLPEEIIKALEAQGLIIAGRYLNTDDPGDIVEALEPMVEKLLEMQSDGAFDQGYEAGFQDGARRDG